MGLGERVGQFVDRWADEGATSDPENIARAYDKSANSAIERFIFQFRAGSFNPKQLASGIGDLCIPPTGKVEVLDVGCNSGAKSKLLLGMLDEIGNTDPHITAIDLSARAIDIAERDNDYPQIEYEVADFLKKDIETESLDYVFMAAVWHHIEDTRAAILKIEESLKPGGVALVFDVFYPENPMLRMLAVAAQKLYREVEEREGVYYNRPLVSEIRNLVRENCDQLELKGSFLTGFLPAIFNTRMAVLQKES